MDLIDFRYIVWFDAFKNDLDLFGRDIAIEVQVSAWGMAEVSHLRGDVSGESFICFGKSPIADELSSDGICCYGAWRWLAFPASQLVDGLPCSLA